MKFYSQNVWNYNPCGWRNRVIAKLVRDFDADVCAFQECGVRTNRVGDAPLPELLRDTYTEVCPQYAGENYTPIFFKTEKHRLIEGGYHQYSGRNDENSKSVTWAVLEERESVRRVAVASTHFWWMAESEQDDLQRIKNAEELQKICENICKKYGISVIIGGDFNNGVNAPQGDHPYRFMLENGFSDVRLNAEETCDVHTHHAYPILTEGDAYADGAEPTCTIDYVFTYGTGVKANMFQVLTTQEALDSSDHCPLLGVFEI